MVNGRRRIGDYLGIALTALILLSCVEAIAFGFLFAMLKREPRVFAFDIDQYVAALPQDHIRAYVRAIENHHIYAPDPLLGWIRSPNSTHTFPDGSITTSDGLAARMSDRAPETALMSAYGDSFTEGLEVNDTETWEEQLGALRNARILNFGVSGYGPDQAVLLMERNLERGIGRTPVVLLALINENLSRLLNAYRAFYTYPYPDVVLGFKPIFLKGPNGFETKTFMPSNILDRQQLADAIRDASGFDPFFSARTEHLRFPFLIQAIGFLRRGNQSRSAVRRNEHHSYADGARARSISSGIRTLPVLAGAGNSARARFRVCGASRTLPSLARRDTLVS